MKCKYCGASGQGSVCEYCGRELEKSSKDKRNSKNEPEQIIQQVTNVYVMNDGKTRIDADGIPQWDEPSKQVPRHQKTEPAQRYEYISHKSKDITLLLCFFLGIFGGHQFYTGHTKKGFLYLFTMGLCGIGTTIDFFMILFNKFKDGNGEPVKGKLSKLTWIVIIVVTIFAVIYGRSQPKYSNSAIPAPAMEQPY